MILRVRRSRICVVCGQEAVDPVRCPFCGAWACREHLARHVETHYVKIRL